MGAHQSVTKIGFEDVQYARHNSGFLLVNTLPETRQSCLIEGTIPADEEVAILNKHLKENIGTRIIVYGENSTDGKVGPKCDQLRALGFYNVYCYEGGLFEWLLLQDIYGADNFRTTSEELEHLKFKSPRLFGVMRLTN